ncbi:MAG TPA: Gfo/Idh/MocA family oxidoreductase [Candidatus Sulfotelmatobacter sp.]|jgi:predicted dehydrogenase|nr:Gfo/Idh/MocA family oxidoreductase [Candidatus Sulfotelmatobacter sp.]
MKPIKTAIFGTGFMGRVHLEAVRRVESVEAAAIAGRNAEVARRLGAAFAVPFITTDHREVLRDPAIDAVHIGTPNAQHFSMAKDALLAGKHVICEKPLTTTVAEAEELVSLAAQQGVRNCVCHNLRYYPMVQQMRRLREAGDLGEILVVQGSYSQDWLLYDTDWNWRVDSKAGGPSRCMADIGSHWFDMAEHVTGLRVTSLCADLQTFHATRKQPKHSVETFANKLLGPEEYVETAVDTEDFGAVIFRMGNRTRGCVTASQVSAGRKNRLSIEIYGTRSSVAWDQERPDELWAGNRDVANQIFVKDPSLLKPGARGYADLPGGHSEGYDDTFKQVFRRFYSSIATPGAAPEYPQFVDGLRQLTILNAELQSHQARSWVDVPAFEIGK